MSDALEIFFSAWQETASDVRQALIEQAVTADVAYDDPRTSATLHGAIALNDYVGLFSAGAPGWRASVVRGDVIAGVARVTVAFTGPGPDGAEVEQLGQYFAEFSGDRICRLVGFVGTGAPD